ncbi:MAG: hypothetical protein PHW02_04035 [bacterium]|nr:hypothetical protein [bacterium]
MKIYYRIFVALTILFALAYFVMNPEKIQGYLPTAILFLTASVSALFIKEVKFSHLFVTLPAAIIFTAYFQRTHEFPELLIIALSRLLLTTLTILPLKRIKIHPILSLVYFNALIFFVFAELILSVVYFVRPSDILKRKNEIFRLTPDSEFNNSIVNEKGYMGRTAETEKKEKRIIFTGDSFGVGVVDYSKNFIQMIDDSTDYECVNLSQPGYSPVDYLSELKLNLPAAEADIAVVLIFAGNDILNISYPENNWSIDNWKVVNFARNAFLLLSNKRNVGSGDSEIKLQRSEYLNLENNRAKVLEAGALTQQWALFEKVIKEIKMILDRNQVKGIFIIIPDEYSVNCQLQNDLSAGKGRDWLYANRKIGAILKENNIDFFDPTEKLSKAYSDGKNPYKENDSHLNELGNLIIFNELKNHLDFMAR